MDVAGGGRLSAPAAAALRVGRGREQGVVEVEVEVVMAVDGEVEGEVEGEVKIGVEAEGEGSLEGSLEEREGDIIAWMGRLVIEIRQQQEASG